MFHKKKTDESVLTLHLPLAFDDYQMYRATLHEIKYYQRVARKAGAELAAIEMAQFPLEAPPTLEKAEMKVWYKQQRDALKAAWGQLLSAAGDQHLYYTPIEGLVHILAPTWPAWLCQQLCRELTAKWFTKDPLLKAPRCALVRSGQRLPLQFNRAPIPLQMTTSVQSVKLLQRGVLLTWDKQLGPVRANLRAKLDDYVYSRFAFLRDHPEHLKSCKLFLREKREDGRKKIFIQLDVAYTPEQIKLEKPLNPARVLEVGSGALYKQWLSLCIREGQRQGQGKPIDAVRKHELYAYAALDQLRQCHARQEQVKRCCEASGHNSQALEKYRFKQEGITLHRKNVMQNWCGVWAKIIVEEAVRWECGSLAVIGLPKEMFGFTWPRAQFYFSLRTRAKMHGIKVSLDTGAEIEDVVNAEGTAAAEVIEDEEKE